MLICHWWPGITFESVWRLDLSEWLLVARTCDLWQREQQKTARR